jgi:methylenetetrahydrofolate reductase (NADPH)
MERVSRYEILPFGAGAEEAAAADEPLTITVTCSPKHGLDRTIEISEQLRTHGHTVVPHMPAKMVRDHAHLDEALQRFSAAGIDEVFVIGGDAPEPHGPFDSAVDLVPIVHAHPLRPKRIGIGAYPEGHPLIAPSALDEALIHKAEMADFIVTQMCFDPGVLLTWLTELRARGVTQPAYLGVPGAVDRRKLLDISMRVGVGQSISFLRKQHGLTKLFRSPHHSTELLYDGLAPHIGDTRYGIAGLHWYTFNQLRATREWELTHAPQHEAAV